MPRKPQDWNTRLNLPKKESNWEKTLERAMKAGRVLTPDIFPDLMAALDKERTAPGTGQADFKAACATVIDDQSVIDSLWNSALQSLNNPVGYCW
jgi:hypothetical protein